MEIGFCKGCYDDNPGTPRWHISNRSQLYKFYKHKKDVQHKQMTSQSSNYPEQRTSSATEGMLKHVACSNMFGFTV